MRKLLDRLFLARPAPQAVLQRKRLRMNTRPQVLYAVGDVHGCLAQLKEIEGKITADAAAFPGSKLIIMLGDYIDRGEHSAQVLDHLLRPAPEGFRRICLCGNHEDAMLAFLRDPVNNPEWLSFGGVETLRSYGIGQDGRINPSGRQFRQMLDIFVPAEHVEFLEGLPVMLVLPGVICVHAGLRPDISITDQDDHDLLWIRNEFFDSDYDFGATVVHGHTPVATPVMSRRHINVDTGAYATGRLTAVRITADGSSQFISTGR